MSTSCKIPSKQHGVDFNISQIRISGFSFGWIKMLSRAFKEHQARQAAHREKQERLRREAVLASSRLTYRMMDTLNIGVEQAYVNQRKLETEAKQLQVHAVRFSKQTVQWLQMLESFNKALKELGDVENWSRVIEADMIAIASALEYAYKGDGPKSSQSH